MVGIGMRQEHDVDAIDAECPQVTRDRRRNAHRRRPNVDQHRSALTLDERRVALADSQKNDPVSRRADQPVAGARKQRSPCQQAR